MMLFQHPIIFFPSPSVWLRRICNIASASHKASPSYSLFFSSLYFWISFSFSFPFSSHSPFHSHFIFTFEYLHFPKNSSSFHLWKCTTLDNLDLMNNLSRMRRKEKEKEKDIREGEGKGGLMAITTLVSCLWKRITWFCTNLPTYNNYFCVVPRNCTEIWVLKMRVKNIVCLCVAHQYSHRERRVKDSNSTRVSDYSEQKNHNDMCDCVHFPRKNTT